MVVTLAPPSLPVKSTYLPHLGCQAHVYVDTVGVWLTAGQRHHPKYKGLVRRLYDANQRPDMGSKRRLIETPSDHGTLVLIHQPTAEAVAILARYGLLLNRVHLAVDMAPDDAARVCRMVQLKWRGQGQQKVVENGIYWSPATTSPDPRGNKKRRTRNLVYYDDRPNKATGEPCGHLEFRFNRLKATKAVGLHNPAAMLNGSFDVEQFLAKQLSVGSFGNKWVKFHHKLAGRLRNNRRPYKRKRLDDITAHQMELWRRHLQRYAGSQYQTPHYPTIYDVPAQVYRDFINHKIEQPQKPGDRKSRMVSPRSDKAKRRLLSLLESH